MQSKQSSKILYYPRIVSTPSKHFPGIYWWRYFLPDIIYPAERIPTHTLVRFEWLSQSYSMAHLIDIQNVVISAMDFEANLTIHTTIAWSALTWFIILQHWLAKRIKFNWMDIPNLVSVENRIRLVVRFDGSKTRFECGFRIPWVNTQNWHKIQLSHSNFWHCRNWMRWQQIRLVLFPFQCYTYTTRTWVILNISRAISHFFVVILIRQMAMLSKYLNPCFRTLLKSL